MEISSGRVCWRQENFLWQAILKSATLPWWVTVQPLELPCSMSCAYLLIFWLTLMNNFLLLSLQEVPQKMFQQSALFLSTSIFMFIFVHLVNVCSILKCKNCVYLCIEDMIHVQHSLWHNYTYVHMHVRVYVCMYIGFYIPSAPSSNCYTNWRHRWPIVHNIYETDHMVGHPRCVFINYIWLNQLSITTNLWWIDVYYLVISYMFRRLWPSSGWWINKKHT